MNEASVANQILLLVDDATGPFWKTTEVWQQWCKDNKWRIIEVTGFHDADALTAVNVKLKAEGGIPTSPTWYVVTDSMFESNRQGGADLLEALRSTRDGREAINWSRAVIYSDQPELGDALASDEVMLVKKYQRHESEARGILAFLETSWRPNIEVLREMLGSLNCVQFCGDASLSAVAQGKHCPPFRPMQSYGKPIEDASQKYWFDPLLLNSQSKIALYTPPTAAYFSSATKVLFVDCFHEGSKLSGRVETPAADAWQIVLQTLHPWESLCPVHTDALPAVRLLWEIARIGADKRHLQNHPSRSSDLLTARERVWVRRQLDNTISSQVENMNNDNNVISLVKRAQQELEDVGKVMSVVSAGEEFLKSEM